VNTVPETLHVPADAPQRNVHSRGNRFASWQEHHRWSAASSLRRLASRPFGSLLTIAVMGLALALPLAFYLLLGNVQQLGRALGQSQAISVFLQPGQTASQAQLLAQQLGERPEVAAVVVKTPQQGMDELAQMQGFSGALQTLDDNPLPYVLQLQPRAGVSAHALEQMVADVRTLRSVDLVQDSGSWRQRLDALLGVGNRVVLVLASLLALAALLVVGNTIRVDRQPQRGDRRAAAGRRQRRVRAPALPVCRDLVWPVQRHPGGVAGGADRAGAGHPGGAVEPGL
jgi:cell division transport system permease protein